VDRLGVSAAPIRSFPAINRLFTADMTHNSANAVPSGTMFVPTWPSVRRHRRNIAPPTETITNGQPHRRFSTSSNDGTASANGG